MTSDARFIAHKTPDGKEQTILEHIEGVLFYADKEGKKIGMEHILMLAGIFHDAGKYQPKFQSYIRGKENISVNHSSVGARMLYDDTSEKGNRALAELVAYGVAAHHGLFDCVDEEKDRFFERLQKTEEYDAARKRFQKEVQGIYDIAKIYKQAEEEWKGLCGKFNEIPKPDVKFYLGCLERLLLSVLIDSDWKDTGKTMGQVNREYDKPQNIFEEAYKNYNKYIRELQKKNKEKEKRGAEKEIEINLLREEIRQECMKFAANPPGCYCLSIPTGGGKTLTALGYGLEYSRHHKEMERMIYVSPFISITEQNSKVIKEAVGNKEWVLEHHSGVAEEDIPGEKNQADPFGETWEEPFVATTAVQFLNTLFSDKKQCIRRMHRLKNAVIIVDEVQSLPIKCIHTFNLMMNFLVKFCNAAVILCTATQPLLECTKRPIIYGQPKEMVKNLSQRFISFERVEIIPKNFQERWDFPETAEFIKEQLKENDNVLAILNSKYSVLQIYDLLKEQEENVDVVYLTTNLCAQHRSEKIKYIKERLEKRDGRKIVVLSTSLIEAGVDISFQCVIRALAGLDSIAQAAGRCNRNGELPVGSVFIIELAEEHIDQMPDIWKGQQAARKIINNYQREEKKESLLSPVWMERYYQEYFMKRIPEMDYYCKNIRKSMLQLLSQGRSTKSAQRKYALLNQAFQMAGKNYRPIEMDGIAVLVKYREAEEKVKQLEQEEDWQEIKRLLRELQRYTVNLYEYKASELWNKGAIQKLEKGGNVIWIASDYNMETGLTEKRPNMIF